MRGEVVDHTLLATMIQEFQPNSFHYTGRTAHVPNSVFFTSPIRNLTVVRDYTFHSFAITAQADTDLPALEAEIAAIVERRYGPHHEEAVRANARIERRSGVDILDPESRIRFSTTDLGKPRVTVSLFCPTNLAEALEDAVTRDVMSLIHAARRKDPAAREEACPPARPPLPMKRGKSKCGISSLSSTRSASSPPPQRPGFGICPERGRCVVSRAMKSSTTPI